MRIILAAVAVTWLLAAAAKASEGDFTDLTGIPVMEGLAVVPDSLVVFDKEEGRILEAALEGEAALSGTIAFYREALFQLGWALIAETPAALAFAREGERLTLEVGVGPRLELRFRLAPEP